MSREYLVMGGFPVLMGLSPAQQSSPLSQGRLTSPGGKVPRFSALGAYLAPAMSTTPAFPALTIPGDDAAAQFDPVVSQGAFEVCV